MVLGLLNFAAFFPLLFLTPMSFLVSTARNARALVERVALVLGLLIGLLRDALAQRRDAALGTLKQQQTRLAGMINGL